MEYAYATLLATDSYLPGVQLMHATLRQFTPTLLVILITPNISKVTRLQLKYLDNVMINEVPDIGKPNTSTGSWESSQYTKLHIWTLVQFKKIFYIDADCMILEDPSPVFEIDTDFAAAPDVFPPDCFNAGVLLVKPSMEFFK